MTYVKVLKLRKKNVMVNNVEGLFEVDKQGTNRTLIIKVCIHLCWIAISACVVDLPGRQPNWLSSRILISIVKRRFLCVCFSKLLSDAVSVNGGDVRVGGIYRHAVY